MSRASSILQRVNSQLRGERVPLKSKEEDELSNYLSNLAQKTGQARKSVNFEDMGENISISSESNLQKTPRARIETPPLRGAASRFLKKKKPDPEEIDHSNVTTPNMSPRGPRRSYRPATSVPNVSPQKSTPTKKKSTPLDKAKALTSKINDRAVDGNKRGTYFETDTDDSVSLANYMQYASADQLKSASEKSIGRDGNRFWKKTKAEKPLEEGENAYMGKIEAPRPSSPAKGQRRPYADRDTSKPPNAAAVPEYANKGQVKYMGNIHLTSEEESMADFINRLSSADDAKKKKTKKRQKSRGRDLPSPDLSLMRTPSPPTQTPRRGPSPIYGRRLSRSPSQDSDNVDSILSEVADTQETESSGNIFNTVNLMDLDSLEPLALSPEPSEKKKKKKSLKKKSEQKESKSKPKQKSKESLSVFKASGKEDIFKAKSSSKKAREPHKTDSVFNNLGLHTVDELLGVSEAKDESIVSEASEIVTEKSDIFAARKRKDSVSSIATEIGVDTPQHQVYSEDFDEDSISERIGQGSLQGGKQVRWSTASEVKTEYSDENTQADYDDDFETDSRARSYSDRTYQSDSEGYTSDTETYTQSYTKSRQDQPLRESRKETKNVEIQTPSDPGLNYRWNLMSSGLAISGPSLGLGFVDPTPIASHVVSADSLEAMTSYSPCMLALHDLMKQQLALTQNFLETQRRMYESSTSMLEDSYKYTTLEDTQEYIRKHRKPRLTFKKALKMVSREMNM